MTIYDQQVEPVDRADFREIGGASLGMSSMLGQIIDSDYNRDLVGNRGMQTYDKMRRGDASVRSSLRVIKAPLLAGEWYFEPYADTELDREVAAFVEAAWQNMSRTPIQVLWEALLMLDFGYYGFEKVYKEATFRPERERARARDVVTWKKWGPRHPLNTVGWDFDAHGGVKALRQYKNALTAEEVRMGIDKLLLFTFDEEGGNPEGISLLRSAYPHWYFKNNLYKVDAIQKERHGIGVPHAELPPNATAADKTLAREMVRNLRTNEKAGIVTPNGWMIEFLEPHGNMVDPLSSAVHHDLMIKANVLAEFLGLGTTASGARAVASTQEDVFTKSIHYIADLVCGVINKWAIPELVLYNYGSQVDGFLKMKVRRLGDTTDIRALSVAIRNFVESGAVTPTPEDEEFLRRIIDWPMPTTEVMERSVDDRTEKTPAQRTGESVADRVEMPTDGA